MGHNFLNSLFAIRLTRTDIINILFIVALWFLMTILVNPLGDFPLNDDWVYGLSVKSILEKGDFRLPAYSSANLLPQAFWGALFCLPFGFSFTALRFSTLTLGLIGVVITYAILRQVKANPEISLLGALLIAFNPIYFGLSNTFMTDVPFFAVTFLSFYFLILGLKHDSNLQIALGIFLSYIALLIRQYGIIITLAFWFAYSVKKGLSVRNIIKGFIPLFTSVLVQVIYQKWMISTNRMPNVSNPQYYTFFHSIKDFFLYHTLVSKFSLTIRVLLHLGLFLLPFIITVCSRKFRYNRQEKLILLSSFFIVVVMGSRLLNLINRRTMPLLGNILTSFGLGPLTLRDTYILQLNYPLIPLVIKISWTLLTTIAILATVLLVYYLVLATLKIFDQAQDSNNQQNKWLIIFIISGLFSYLSLVVLSGPSDRYLLPLLPLSMIAILLSTKDVIKKNLGGKITSLVVIMLLLLYGGFTIGATHDYLAWNRSRWQALNDLMEESRILPNNIDGGYEFNGWYLYDFKYKKSRDKSRWWVDNDDYIISFGPLDGYEAVKQYPVRRLLFFGPRDIFVLHRSAKANSVKP